MSVTGIQNEINRIKQNIENAYSIYEAFGADIPTEKTSDNLVPTAGTMKPVLYSPQTLTDAQKEQVRNNIGASRTTVLGDNPTGGVANDTVDTWSNLGNGVAWISEQNQVIDQPSQYGFIINYIHETNIFQIFHDQTNGETYFRSGDNVNNWFQNWRRVPITNGDDYINAAGVRASEMITVGDDNSAMVIYTNGIGDRNSKLWIDAYGEAYFTEVYARQKKLATEEYVNEAVEQLSNEKVDKTGISLGIGADGLIYIHVNGVPVGTGIEQGASGDVNGYIDENNVILLTGTLPKATYSFKFVMEDGTTVDIGELSFVPEPTYANLVPTSIDTDGSVYNGVGYQDGVRGNSSGTTSALSGATTSGLIPFDLRTDTIRVAGVDRAQSAVSDANYTYVTLHKADRSIYAFAKAGARANATIGYKNSGWPIVDSNGVEVLYSPDNTGSIDMKTTASDYETVLDVIKYVRVTGKGSGANLIITKNEEIV